MRSEAIKTGNRFSKWCKLMGRSKPPVEIKKALNSSMDEGSKMIKNYISIDSSVWRNYCSFLAGRGHGRV
jgi:hypothetical protein